MLKNYFNSLSDENMQDRMASVKQKLQMNMGIKLVDSYRIEQEKEQEMKRRFEHKRVLLKAGPRSL